MARNGQKTVEAVNIDDDPRISSIEWSLVKTLKIYITRLVQTMQG